jgi:HK97 gp10 family phage protein
MSLTVDIEVRLKDALSKLDVAAVERLANQALKSGGLVIANEWKRRAPIKTGTYRRSIHVAGAADKTPDFEGTELAEPDDKLTVKVGTNIKEPPYPEFLEYGTSRMPPHPSAGPAMDVAREDALKEVAAALAELVAKELGK